MGVHLLFQISEPSKIFKIRSLRKSTTVLNRSKELHASLSTPAPHSHSALYLTLGKLSNLLVAQDLSCNNNVPTSKNNDKDLMSYYT